MRRTIMLTAAAALLLFVVDRAHSAALFSTSFTTSTLDSNLQDPGDAQDVPDGTDPTAYLINTGAGNIHLDSTSEGDGARAYITTVDSNYLNFKYQLTFTAPDLSLAFIGVGAGTPTAPYNEPGNNSLMFRLASPAIGSGVVNVVYYGAPGNIDYGNLTGIAPNAGPHRVQIARSGDLVTFGIDYGYAGGAYNADESMTIDLSLVGNAGVKAALDAQTRLFFGSGQNLVTFDDFSVTVVPEPTSLFLLGTSSIAMLALARRRRRAQGM